MPSSAGGLLFRSDRLARRTLPSCVAPRSPPITKGHPGQSRMFQRLRRTYYWPQTAADTVSTVRECTQCSKNRFRLIRQVNPMRLFPPTKPLECVAIDILGPIPTSKCGTVQRGVAQFLHAHPMTICYGHPAMSADLDCGRVRMLVAIPALWSTMHPLLARYLHCGL